MTYETPESIIARTSAALKANLLAGQHYDLLSPLAELTTAVEALITRIPSPEGWMSTKGRPHPGPAKWFYVYHEAYGVGLAIYSAGDWEDRKFWVEDNHGDHVFIRPRFGWAYQKADGNMLMLTPQPSHYLPEPPPPSL